MSVRLAKSINPVPLLRKIARESNPLRMYKAISKGVKNTGSPEAVRGAIEAGKGFTYWFGGLIGIGVGILNPVLMHFQYKKKGVPKEERNALVVQESANQAVNVVVHMLCYFGLSTLVGKKLAKIPGINKDLVDITKILIANIGGFLGQGIVRPILGSTILMKWKDNQKAKNGGVDPAKEAEGKQQTETPKLQSAPSQQPSAQDQELQQLLQMLEQQAAPAAAPQPQPPSFPPPPQPPVFPQPPAMPAPNVFQTAPLPPAFPAPTGFPPQPTFGPMTPPPPPPAFPGAPAGGFPTPTGGFPLSFPGPQSPFIQPPPFSR